MRRYRWSGNPFAHRWLLAALLALAAAPAIGQQQAEAAEESTISELNSGQPQDLPGHEKGPRTAGQAEPEPPAAPETPGPRDWFGGKPWWEWSTVTGDWGGARTSLEERGITFAGSYLLDWSSVWSGGLRNVASTRSLVDLNATVDLDRLAGWHGAAVFFDFQSTDMRGGSADVGDFQGIDNVESGRNMDQISELWFEQKLFDGRVRFKLGKIDANAEFAFLDAAAGVVSSTGSISATMLGNPTYPDPATGIVAFAYPTDWFYAGGGFFDGATMDGYPTGPRGPATFFSDDKSSSWYWIGELGLTWKQLAGVGKGRLAGGIWHHTAEFSRFDGGVDDGATGFYLVGEQQVVARGESEELAGKGLFVFARYGWADEEVSDAGNHLGVGVSVFGTFGGRDDDEAGLYYSYVDLSDDRDAGYAEDEHLIELYYMVQVTPWLTVRPDVQFVLNPGGDSTIDDAVVGMLRFEVTF